jgi:glycosyltransferase involved in cell wall biosynthesis
MKICFITFEYPQLEIGGAGVYALHVTRELAKLGHEVHVISRNINGREVYSIENDVFVHRIPSISKRFLNAPSFWFILAKKYSKIRKDVGDFDIVHSNAGSGIFSPILHVETHHHTPSALHAFPHYLPALLSAVRAKRVIAVSEVSKRDLMRHGISEHKIKVIYHGVDFHRFKNVDGSAFRDALGIGDAKLLLYVGGFNKNKNLIFLLKVIKQLNKMGRKVFLLMIGVHDNEERRLLNVARDLDVLDVVRTMYLSDDMLPQAYSACDLFVFSSKKEGFGLPLLEAVACGKRFVSTPVGIAPKLAKMGFGRIASYSTNDFLLKIIRELDEQPHSPSLQVIKREFNWINTAKKTLQVYKMILNDSDE